MRKLKLTEVKRIKSRLIKKGVWDKRSCLPRSKAGTLICYARLFHKSGRIYLTCGFASMLGLVLGTGTIELHMGDPLSP